VTRSDLVYSIVCSYLSDQVGCTEARNIIEKVGGSAGFEILIHASQEKNKCNSKRQSKKMKTGTHNFQVAAKTILDEWGVNVPEGENVMSIYESIKMKTGTHNFQVHAKTILDEWGVNVPKGENVMSIYESEKMKTGTHSFQVAAKTILDEWGVNVPEGEKVMSIYESEKMKTGTHNFQVAAKTILDEWGVNVPEGENAISIYNSKRNKDLLDNGKHNFQAKGFSEETSKRVNDQIAKGEHNFQKMSKETIEKRDIKSRLVRIAKAMDIWDEQFELFKKFDVMPSRSGCNWISVQRNKTGTKGITSKVNFVAEHNKGNPHWKKRLAELVAECERKGGKLFSSP
jgi:hypothetical protein